MFINPILLADKILSGTEKLDGTQIAAMTIVGLVVVFSALLILVGYLLVSGGIFKKTNHAPKKQPAVKKPAPKQPAQAKAAPPAQKPKKPAPAPATPTAAASDEDEEVIAVIMAAIAAMSEADGTAYQIRSVKRVTRGGAGRSVWAQAGLSEATKPF